MNTFGCAVLSAALTALASMGMASGAAAGPVCPTVEVAKVVAADAGGARLFPGPQGQGVSVAASPIVTVHDVAKADISYAEGVWGLGLTLRPQAAERIRAYTAAHVGESLAFVVEGRAKMVARVLDPIGGDGIWISPYDKAQAQALAAGINACVTPGA